MLNRGFEGRLRRRRGTSLVLAFLSSLAFILTGCGGGGGSGSGTAGTDSLLGGSPLGSAGTPGGTGRISGTVIDSTSGNAVSNAQVMVADKASVTSATGFYEISNVPSGTLMVIASRSGFTARSKLVFLDDGAQTTLDFGLIPTTSTGGTGGGTTATGPIVTSSNPASNQTSVDPSSQILFTFDQAVDVATVNPSTIVFARTAPSSAQDSGASSIDNIVGNTYRYNPGGLQMETSASYGLFVTNRVQGTNSLFSPGSDFRWSTRESTQTTGTGGGSTPQVPKVIFRSPNNGATNVDTSTRILFQFDQAMDTSSVTVGTSNLVFSQLTAPSTDDLGPTRNVTPVAGLDNAFEYIPSTTFTPLNPGTTYGLFITNKILSQAGVPADGEVISFTTRSSSAVTTGPVVIQTNPVNGATNIVTSTAIFVTYDRAIDADSADSAINPSVATMVKTSPTIEVVSVTTSRDPVDFNKLVITPVGGLDSGSDYIVATSNSVVSLAGNPAEGRSFTFKTIATSGDAGGGGIIIPTLTSSNPTNGTINVDTNTGILLTFSTDMDLTSLQGAGAVIVNQASGPGGPGGDLILQSPAVQAVTGIDRTYRILVDTAENPLIGNTNYTVFLTNSIRADGANEGFLDPTLFTFLTRDQQGGIGDVTRPLLAATNPTDGAINVNTKAQIFFTFSELVQVATVNVNSVSLAQTSTPSAFVSVTINPTPTNPTTILVDTVPTSAAADFQFNLQGNPLSPGESYELSFTNEIQDGNNNRLLPTNIQFATSSTLDSPVGPKLASSSPAPNTTNVDPSSRILFTFDKDVCISDTGNIEIDCPTINPTNVILTRITSPATLDGPLAGTDNPTITRPNATLFPRTFEYTPGTLSLQPGLNQYSLFITNRVEDAAGSAAPGDSFAFTTRDITVQPGQGPRIVSSNPQFGATVGPQPRLLIQFDKPIDQVASGMSMISGPVQGLNVLGLRDDASDGICGIDPLSGISDDVICTPPPFGTTEIFNCNCVTPLNVTGYAGVGTSFGLADDDLIIEVLYAGNLTEVMTWVSINGFLVDDDGNPAPPDSFFFFSP